MNNAEFAKERKQLLKDSKEDLVDYILSVHGAILQLYNKLGLEDADLWDDEELVNLIAEAKNDRMANIDDLKFLQEMHGITQHLITKQYDICKLELLNKMIEDWKDELESRINH